MYYRRKILLSLLQVFDNQLDEISLQILLFLLARCQENKSFHFVPSKLGCFSFQANADLNTMSKYKLVESSMNDWKKIDDKDYFEELNSKDKLKEILSLLKSKKRIALTCFEANIHQCHRKHLAESISLMEGFSYEVKHI
jgi:uncharacterized protein (DUF488 family)